MQKALTIIGGSLFGVLLIVAVIFSIISATNSSGLSSDDLIAMEERLDKKSAALRGSVGSMQADLSKVGAGTSALRAETIGLFASITQSQGAISEALGVILREVEDEFSPSKIFNYAREEVVEVFEGSRLLGTGWFVSPDEITTVTHVISGVPIGELTVVTANGKTLYVKNTKADQDQDIAILKLNEDFSQNPLQISDPSSVVVGDQIVIIGHPNGQRFTATVGIVSGLNEKIQSFAILCSTCTEMVQIDAAVGFGNSGGPVLNKTGDVVGTVSGINGIFTVAVSNKHLKKLLAEPYEDLENPPTGEIQILLGWREHSPNPIKEGELAVLLMLNLCLDREDARLEGVEFSVKGGITIKRYILYFENARIGVASGGMRPKFTIDETVVIPSGGCNGLLELVGLVGNTSGPVQVTLTDLRATGMLSGNTVRVLGKGQGGARIPFQEIYPDIAVEVFEPKEVFEAPTR